MTELKVGLYQNAVDSIKHGFEHYTTDTDEIRRYKYAISHIAHGVFLILKERLSLEHPTLINTEVTSSKKTVDVKSTLERLRKIANIDFGSSEKAIIDFAELRNGIEHHEFDISTDYADDLISQIVPIIHDFLKEHFKSDIQNTIGHDTWKALINIPNYRQNRVRAVKDHIKKNKHKAYKCNSCQEQTALEQPKEDDTHNVATIVCQVCLEFYWFVTQCQECGRKVNLTTTNYVEMRNARYCDDCVSKIQDEFPRHIYPRFILETRRWFKTHETAIYDDLERFLGAAESHGPTARRERVEELISNGVVEFTYESDKERYDFMKSSHLFGYLPHIGDLVTFKWSWKGPKKRG